MVASIENWPLTLKQFLRLPEAKPALEMGPDGDVTQKVSPTSKHGALQSELSARLREHAHARKLGRTFTEQRVVLGRATRVPDVSFYRQERLPLTPEGDYVDHPTTPPDLVAEIYSPGQEGRRELRVRAEWFVEQGVSVVLLVDPERQAVTVVTADGEAVYLADTPLPLDPVLPDLRITPAELFSALRP
jgi:Uma2 family endonuclease